jgi:porin
MAIGISYNFSTRETVDLEDVYLPSELSQSSPKMPDSFVLRFGHQFWPSPVRPGKGIGFYGRVGASGGNPNPIQWSLACGITGEGMWTSRPWDGFGIGICHYEWSNGLSTALLSPVGPETGLEAYYNFAVTSWFVVTTDLQVIDPATEGSPVFTVFGLRALVRF